MQERSKRIPKRQRRGAIIVLIALLLPILFILVGFSVDLANMQRTRTELRAATDLAAKAAAAELAESGDQADAIDKGKQIANLNLVAGDGLTLRNNDFEFGRATEQGSGKWTFVPGGAAPNSVRITGSRTASSADGAIGTFFGNFYGQSSFEPSLASAAAFINVDICLVLDRSSSMKLALHETGGLLHTDPRTCSPADSSARWQDLDTAVRVFLDELDDTPGSENVAMVTFGGPMPTPPTCNVAADHSVVSIDQDLTTNIGAIESALDARTSSVWNGNTDIKNGLQQGINVLLGARPGADRVMILFSDGQYTEEDPVPLGSTAVANDIVVHTITFGNLPTDPSNDWIADMQAIASATGGTHLHAPNAQALVDAFKDIASSLAKLIQ